MSKGSFPSDAISLKGISTGDNSAGNGGNGTNSGNISNSPSINFNPTNKAEGADVHVNTGDKVYQKADWDAGGAKTTADWFSKAYGGKTTSDGDQSSKSGHDTSKVDASTTAYQTNFLAADMSSERGGRHWRQRRKWQQGGRRRRSHQGLDRVPST